MSGDDWLVVGDSEETAWQGHPRLMTVLPAMVVGLVLVVGAIAVTTVEGEPLALLLVPVGIAIPVFSYLVVSNTQFVVTDRALYRKTGVLSRSVQRLSVDRIQNSSFRQGIRGSLFGYGTVEIEAAGGGYIRFNDIENPRDVRAMVDLHATGDSIPGSLDQWEAILVEVRALRSAIERNSSGR
ncbi:PH domain-containing protein [Haladaptatus sp. DFWS20]|uniref:PH domain-containing protein n=1 Tax=Haladaptatus sp. DFWS20 TaxID=3403467 RepID=UPI003EC14396